MRLHCLAALLVLAALLPAQTPPPPEPSIRTSGEATITARPDEARIDIGVITQAQTADAAAAQNARRTDAVTRALRTAASGAEIRTVGYSLEPNYRFPKPGGPPEVVNYTARNTVEVVTGDLAGIGKLIDAALQAGANNIDRLRFTLKDESAVRAQALRQAAATARAKAEAIAGGLGLKITRVLSVEESGAQPPRPMMAEMGMQARTMAAPATPVEAGTLEIHAAVTIRVAVQ